MGISQKLIRGVVLLILLCTASCNTVDPPDKTVLTLTLEDVSCTEAWITLTTNNLQLPATLNLLKDNTITKTINLQTADTILYIDSLLPNQTYKFQTSGIGNPVSGIRSNEINITTMDTTSHDFTFQTWTFGTIGSSSLYDVAIINEQNIWCVGEILIADTSENGYTMYNAVHWDGSEWTLHRIMFYTFCGQQHQNAYPARSVFAIDDETIIVGSNSQVAYLKNGVQTKIDCIPASVNKIWGSSSDNVYLVGNNGSIAHYNGSQWSRIESRTDVNLRDIYGTPDGKTVWISGYEDFKPTVLLKISNSIIETVFNTRDYLFVNSPDHISGGIVSVWTNNNNFVYITTWYGLYRKSIYLDPLREEYLPPSGQGRPSSLDWHGIRSRATDINNIFTSGNRGTVHHFNGVTYRTYQELADNNVTYYSLDVKGNLSVLCGQKFENGISDKAIITLIK